MIKSITLLSLCCVLCAIGCKENQKIATTEESSIEIWSRMECFENEPLSVTEAWIIKLHENKSFKMIYFYQPPHGDHLVKKYTGTFEQTVEKIYFSFKGGDELPNDMEGNNAQGVFVGQNLKISLEGESLMSFRKRETLPKDLKEAIK